MEIHILYLAWITALIFTVLSYYARNNYAFPVLAGIMWIITGLGFVNVEYIGFDINGQGVGYNQLAQLDTVNGPMFAMMVLFRVIGLIMFMFTFGWFIQGKRVGDDV
jgi:hypothetical protein